MGFQETPIWDKLLKDTPREKVPQLWRGLKPKRKSPVKKEK